MIDEIPSLDSQMTSKYSGQLKDKLDQFLSGYNKIVLDFKNSKIAFNDKKADIRAKDNANNTLSKKYRQRRINDNIRLNKWLSFRYDSTGKIRGKQEQAIGGPSCQYQRRINKLCNYYHRLSLLGSTDISNFNNWYNTQASANVVIDGNVDTVEFESQNEIVDFYDITLDDLSANTFPKENVTNGYSSNMKTNYGHEIYYLSKFQYVIDYPSNIVSYDSYNYTSVDYNQAFSYPQYVDNYSISICNLYNKIMTQRNNIRVEFLNRRNKRLNYINYVNESLNSLIPTFNTYNSSLSEQIKTKYLLELDMNMSLYDELELTDNYIWCDKIIKTLKDYRTKTYPPEKNGYYGQYFYQLYTFE